MALIVSLVLAEVFLRSCHPIGFRAPIDRHRGDEWRKLVHRASSIPGLTYELNPGAHGRFLDMDCAINSLGMRGQEVEARKTSETMRIVAIGDSVTFGWNVSAHAAWPMQLESTLTVRMDPRRVQVLDCAVSGYNTHDEAIAFEARAKQLRPDIVVLGYFLNDPELAPMAPLQRYFEHPSWWQQFNLLRLFASALYANDVRRFGGGDYYRYLHAKEGPCWPRELEAIDRMRDVARAQVPHTLVVIFPAFPREGEWSDYPWRDLHAQVAEAWTDRGLDVLDLLTMFERSGSPPRELTVDTEHPNPRGHELAAKAIADELARLGWVDLK